MTPAEVARRRPLATSDLFRNVATVRLSADADRIGADARFLMRGGLGSCSPDFYVNGHFLGTLTASELDTAVRPAEITGIEIYSDAAAPPPFRRTRLGPDEACGSVVIWTR